MKKRLSVILIVSMVINMTLPHAAVFANEIDKTGDTGQSKIAEQLKTDLGEGRADELMGVTKKSVEHTKISFDSNDSGNLYGNGSNNSSNDDSLSLNEIPTTTKINNGDNNGDAPNKNQSGNIVDPENDGGENENGTGYAEEPEGE